MQPLCLPYCGSIGTPPDNLALWEGKLAMRFLASYPPIIIPAGIPAGDIAPKEPKEPLFASSSG